MDINEITFVQSRVNDAIKSYFTTRKLKYPKDADEALQWTITELGEVTELLLDRKGGWTRNNPQDHPPFSKAELSKELGDVLLMVLVAGYVEGVNPLASMLHRIKTFIHPEPES